MKRVTGLGGIFFKTPGPEELKGWHRRHLGIEADPGVSLSCGASSTIPRSAATRCGARSRARPGTSPPASSRSWSITGSTTSKRCCRCCARKGSRWSTDRSWEENGKFAWILDPEGRKIELWEPVDSSADPYLPQD